MKIECKYYNGAVKPCLHYITGGFCKLPIMFRCSEYERRKRDDGTPKYKLEISYSQSVLFTACKRKWYLSRKWELIEKPLPIKLGIYASNILDSIHSEQPAESIEQIMKRIGEEERKGDMQELPEQILNLIGLFTWYKDSSFAQMKRFVQKEVSAVIDECYLLSGILDFYSEEGAYEFKYTSNPDGYTAFVVSHQLFTYLYLCPEIRKITLRVIRQPKMRKQKEESEEAFVERIADSCSKVPNHYIRDVIYWRNEMDKQKLESWYMAMINEMLYCQEQIDKGQDPMLVYYPTAYRQICFSSNCEYLPVCESGNISELIYKPKEESYEQKHSESAGI